MKRTFLEKGILQASALALQNITDLEKVIDWNIIHGVRLYRMSSDMFPWMSEYDIEDLPHIREIESILVHIGEKAKAHNHRLTFHPGPFNVLASANESVVAKTIKDLRQHGEIMDRLGLPCSPFSKINIHIGGAYGDKKSALNRFLKNLSRLPKTARNRLTVENDDKANMFSISDLLFVHETSGIPVVFDYLHHQFCGGNLIEEEALELAVSTWPHTISPVVHFSSSRKRYEDGTALAPSHADFVYEPVLRYGFPVDIMLEAKAKEQALLKYKTEFEIIDPVL